MAFSELWAQLALGGGHWADGQLGGAAERVFV